MKYNVTKRESEFQLHGGKALLYRDGVGMALPARRPGLHFLSLSLSLSFSFYLSLSLSSLLSPKNAESFLRLLG